MCCPDLPNPTVWHLTFPWVHHLVLHILLQLIIEALQEVKHTKTIQKSSLQIHTQTHTDTHRRRHTHTHTHTHTHGSYIRTNVRTCVHMPIHQEDTVYIRMYIRTHATTQHCLPVGPAVPTLSTSHLSNTFSKSILHVMQHVDHNALHTYTQRHTYMRMYVQLNTIICYSTPSTHKGTAPSTLTCSAIAKLTDACLPQTL